MNSDESRNVPLRMSVHGSPSSLASRLLAHHLVVNDDGMRAAAERQGEQTWKGVLHERFYTRPDRATANSKVAFVKKSMRSYDG